MKLTLAQEKALRLVAAGRHDCETTATKVTRLLRARGLLAFSEVNGRVAYVLTEAGRKQLGESDTPREGDFYNDDEGHDEYGKPL